MNLPGRVVTVNESHGLRRDAIEELLDVLEPVRGHNLWIFTTTNDGQERLFEESIDAHPILSRCFPIQLARQGLAGPFADYLARVDPSPGKPESFYRRLIQDSKNNLRAALMKLESEAMGGD